jgi:outer membrane protein OmpA-like peptidoglycan-associated protein
MSVLPAPRARRAAVGAAVAGALLLGGLAGASPAAATGTYQNVGLGIAWESGPIGMTATFLEQDGVALNNCSGDLSTPGCNFTFVSKIGGLDDNASSQPTTGGFPNGDFLPLVDGFGNGAFGQTFTATATGELTTFTMKLTCVDQTGDGIEGVSAAIYETDDLGVHIVGGSLAGGPVDLSTCPTDTTAGNVDDWQPASFTSVPLPVTGADLVSGHHYTVLFGGSFVGGTQPPGLSNTPNAPTSLVVTPGDTRLSVAFTAPTDDGGSAITGYEWTTDGGTSWHDAGRTTSPVTITGLTNGTAYTLQIRALNANGNGIASAEATGTPAAPVRPTTVRPLLATWTAKAGHQSTLRLLRTPGTPAATLTTSTPTVCSVTGAYVVFHVAKTCRVSVVQGGAVYRTFTARVSPKAKPSGMAHAEHVRAVPFAPESARLTKQARAMLVKLAPRLRESTLVVVHGFAAGDLRSGQNSYTRRLTQARAHAVASFLRFLGVEVLFARGFTTLLPLDAKHPDRAINRRADVAWR